MAPLEEKYKIFISKHEMETICLLLEGIAREKKVLLFGAKEMAQLFGIEAPHTAKQSE